MLLGAAATKVLPLIALLIQVAAGIVDFNVDGNPKADAQMCCMVEHSFPQEPLRECYASHLTGGQTATLETVMCIHRCYYEAIGMVSGRKVEGDKYIEYGEKLDEDLREAFQWALRYCAAFVTEVCKKQAELRKMRCDPVPYLFNRCLVEAGIVNCPPARWMNSTLCSKLTLKLKEKYTESIQLSVAQKKFS